MEAIPNEGYGLSMGLDISGLEMVRVLERLGFVVIRRERHTVMSHPDRPNERVIVPNHRTALAPGTLSSIVKQAKITRDDVRREM